jgi:hypothetical protein
MNDVGLPEADLLEGFEKFEFDDMSESLLERFREMQKSVHRYIVYPSMLDVNVIHKCAFIAGKVKTYDSKYGDKDRYIAFPAFGVETGMHYKQADMYNGKPFVLMLPLPSMLDMFNWAGGINFEEMISKHKQELGYWPSYELHFYKRTKRRYRIAYLALVDADGKGFDEKNRPVNYFTFIRTLYEDKYIDKKIKRGN